VTRFVVVALLACNSGSAATTAPPREEIVVVDPAPALEKEPAQPEPAQPEAPPEPDAPKETITIVSIDPMKGELAEQLLIEAGKAKKAGKTAYVELWAGWCPPCKKVDALLEDPALQERLGTVVLIRVDTDQFNKPLTKLGFKSPTIPAFYEIDGRGKPTSRLLHGHSWKNATTIAEKLPAFLLGAT
jgi:thiol-disulfide isomerase/thioredoxin